MKKLVCAAAAALSMGSGLAAPVSPIRYDMPNGDGQASGGSLNYWDRNYTGAGSTTTDGAALSGGLGKLTDGVISTGVWNTVSNALGTGEYVGWRGSASANPLITFSFDPATVVDSITVYLDNSGFGGVFAPTSILIDGVSRAFTAPALGSVGGVSFTGLNLVGGQHTLQFFQRSVGDWVFVSEIDFDGRLVTAVPEPDSAALAAMALLSLAGLRRSGAARRLHRRS